MTTQTSIHSVIGMLHAQELLTLSIVRALPREARCAIADEMKAHAEVSTQPHASGSAQRDTLEAFHANVKRLAIVLASLS
ncbi:hypothetical protein AB1286_29300 [Trinickia sp. NRRL B-1857]|uniref:hypothetical protein n=1 Tax=Trinickia sp. NRRL B-1857 TaxID=3162879 RepID=UPI003D2E14C8